MDHIIPVLIFAIFVLGACDRIHRHEVKSVPPPPAIELPLDPKAQELWPNSDCDPDVYDIFSDACNHAVRKII